MTAPSSPVMAEPSQPSSACQAAPGAGRSPAAVWSLGEIAMPHLAANGWIAPLRRRAKRVLVVDDDRDIRELLVELLSTEGYEVSAAGDGQRALDEARARRPDVILLDLMMPVMNGWEFREAQLKDLELASIPVVIVSAFDDRLDVAAVHRKPFQIEEVLATVQRLTA